MARVTLKDVAKRAGVSFKTVSRVINHEPNVAVETYEKVNRAVIELNYVPNLAARNLSRGRARAIGLVSGWPVNTPFTSTLIEQCLDECNQKGYSMVLFSLGKDIARRIADAYLGKQVDGIVLDTNAAEADELKDQLNTLKIPYVIIHPNRKLGHSNASFVSINNIEAAKQATSYLVKLGHRSIGYITYRSGLNQEEERLRGYCLALEEAGLPTCKDWVYEGTDTAFKLGYNGASQLISRHPEITAIFTETDDIAMGVVSAVWQMGLKIPDDLSVVGFDDISYATMITPPLTTIHQPIIEIARTAVKLLISRIENPATDHIDLVMSTQLVVRDTCRPPRLEPSLITVTP
jgi:DNA-binding LacI/PurR family transcriptional regulator